MVTLLAGLLYLFTFIIGNLVGSFLNLVSDRVVTGEPILFGRSKCDYCKKTLGSKNLIPLLSFLVQKGKSLCCNRKLSFYYPLSEVLTGAVFMFSFKFSNVFSEPSFANFVALAYLLTIFSFFIVLLLTDAKHHLLPDNIVYKAIFATLFFVLVLAFLDLKIYRERLLADDFGRYLIAAGFWQSRVIAVIKQLLVMISSAFFISLFFMALIFATKGRGMGGGDVKLGFLIGIFNGFPQNILAIFLGFLFGAVYSLMLILLKRKKIKDTIAFGPFLIIGSFVAFVYGNVILNWYLGFY